jgi:hypothetical protein
MATRAEQARARVQRAGHHQAKKPRVRKGARAREEARRVTSGHYSGGITAQRNVEVDRGEHAAYDLEDSATGRPSRKSTRKGAHRAKPDSQLRRRAMRRTRSPESRAAREPRAPRARG